MSVGNWNSSSFCTPEDLENYESDIMDKVGSMENAEKKISMIKEEIAVRLRPIVIRILDRNGISTGNWPDEVLDLIQNPEAFKHVNIFGALALIFEDQIQEGAEYADGKKNNYSIKYIEERGFAENRIRLDEDASGDITADERLKLRGFVRVFV